MKLQDLKKETNRLLGKLPAQADWDDLMYHIYVRKKIDAGLHDSAAGRGVTSKQIRKSLKIAP
jgi:predicted transcriptional regulator